MQFSTLSPLSPLASILIDIERSIVAKLYYPALLVSITIPEICSGLALEKKVFVKEKHYVAFVDKYTSESELGIDGIGCFRLRGGIVHRANMAGHPFFGSSHVVFTIPETGAKFHALTIRQNDKRAMMLDLIMFCSSMVGAAHKWYEDHKNDRKVIDNMNTLIRYCPEGLSPFVGGAPVVASGE